MEHDELLEDYYVVSAAERSIGSSRDKQVLSSSRSAAFHAFTATL